MRPPRADIPVPVRPAPDHSATSVTRRVSAGCREQLDWTLVGEVVALESGLRAAAALEELDAAAQEARLRKIGEVPAERYFEISGSS